MATTPLPRGVDERRVFVLPPAADRRRRASRDATATAAAVVAVVVVVVMDAVVAEEIADQKLGARGGLGRDRARAAGRVVVVVARPRAVGAVGTPGAEHGGGGEPRERGDGFEVERLAQLDPDRYS